MVRANYTNLSKGIHETTEYLELFLRNLLLGKHNVLKNRYLHIRWNDIKQDIDNKIQDIQQKKQDIGNKKSTLKLCFHMKKFWKLMELKERHLVTSEIYMEYLDMKEYLDELIL